jgi:hypothetical protein
VVLRRHACGTRRTTERGRARHERLGSECGGGDVQGATLPSFALETLWLRVVRVVRGLPEQLRGLPEQLRVSR